MKPQTKICSVCHKRKDVRYFYSTPNGRLGVRGECMKCTMTRRHINLIAKRRANARTTVQFAHVSQNQPLYA